MAVTWIRCRLKKTISILNTATAEIAEIATEPARREPPLPFSLETLQSEASKRWGYTLKKTLDIAQSLYDTHALLTYPRVEAQYLSLAQFDERHPILAHLCDNFDSYQRVINSLPNLDGPPRAFNDQKLKGEAHSAIIPTSEAAGNAVKSLTAAERNIYHLVAQRYLVQFLNAHERENTTIMTAVSPIDKSASYHFRSSGYTVTEPGWMPIAAALDATGYFSGTKKSKEVLSDPDPALPPVSRNDGVDVIDMDLKATKTKPPKPYTEGALGKDMRNIAKFVAHGPTREILLKKEKAGIGTSATLASHIETLKKRGYVIQKNRFLRASSIGQQLIKALPDIVKRPDITALLENQAKEVEQGVQPFETVLGITQRLVEELVAKAKHTELTLTEIYDDPCPKCTTANRQGSLKPIKTKKKESAWVCTNGECDAFYTTYRGKPFTAELSCLACHQHPLQRAKSQHGYYFRCSACNTTFSDEKGKPVSKKTKLYKPAHS